MPSHAIEETAALTAEPTGRELASPCVDRSRHAHRVEQDVRRHLLAEPSMRFSSLVVRRLENGICLQGVMQVDEGAEDVCSLASRVAGVDQVINQLVVTG